MALAAPSGDAVHAHTYFGVVRKVGEMRVKKGFEHRKGVDAILCAFARAAGVDGLLTLLPLNVVPEAEERVAFLFAPRIWTEKNQLSRITERTSPRPTQLPARFSSRFWPRCVRIQRLSRILRKRSCPSSTDSPTSPPNRVQLLQKSGPPDPHIALIRLISP
jgi:hypothetical protein